MAEDTFCSSSTSDTPGKAALARSALFFLALGGITFYFVYSPALNIPFAYHDHFRFFREDFHKPSELRKHRNNDYEYQFLREIGRPVYAEIEFNTFRNVAAIKDLTFFRYVTVFLMALSAALIAAWLSYLGLSRHIAFLISASLFTLPGIQNFVCMASIPNVLTILLTICASLVLYRLKGVAIRDFSKRDLVGVIGSLLLLMAGLFTYPTTSFLFLLLPLTLILFGKLENWAETRRVALHHFIMLGLASLLYVIIVKSFFSENLTDIPDSYSVGFTADIGGKIRWFVVDVSIWALNVWNVYVKSEVALAVALLICLGVLARILVFLNSEYFHRGKAEATGRGLQAIATAVVLVLAINGPILAMSGSLMLFRNILAYTVAIAVVLFFALRAMVDALAGRFAGTITTAIFCLVFTGSAVYANFNMTSNALNLYSESLFVSTQLAGHLDEDIKRIHVITPHSNGKRLKYGYNGRRQITGEFNAGALTHQAWVTENVRAAMLNVMDRNEFALVNGGKGDSIEEWLETTSGRSIIVTYSEIGEPIRMTPNTVIVDMNDLMRVSYERNRSMEDCIAPVNVPTGLEHDTANAFDRNPNTFWEAGGPFPHWIVRDFGDHPRAIKTYALQAGPPRHPVRDSLGRMPKDWQFQGSNDGKKWTVLDVQKDQTNWQPGESRVFDCPFSGSYRYYRLYVTSGADPKILRLYELTF